MPEQEPLGWIQLNLDRYIEIDVPRGGIALSELTVEAWIRYQPDRWGSVVELRNDTRYVQLRGGQQPKGTWPFFLGFYIPGGYSASKGDPTGYRWKHVAWVFEKIGPRKHRFKLYLDGGLFTRDYDFQTFPEGSFDTITLGSSRPAEGQGLYRFAGDLAQVRLWDRPLPGQKIRWNVQKDREHQPIVKDSHLIGWWRLDDLKDGHPPTVPDSSGHGHHGTVVETAARRVGSRRQARSRSVRGRPQ